MIAHTKVIANQQFTICICPHCGHHIPVLGLLKISPNTEFPCDKCKSMSIVRAITEQTINVEVALSVPVEKGDKVVFRRHEEFESTPMKTDSSETKKAGANDAVYATKNNDISWRCPFCLEMNYELWADDGDKIMCANCEGEIKIYVDSI